MLNELSLLKDVKLLSTVSGGTFAGVAYAVSQSEEQEFDKFFERFSSFLLNTNAIENALKALCATPSPSGAKGVSLIRSAAASYSATLFGDQTFKQLLNITKPNGRFKELIFNSTEFRQGNSFRFRASSNSDAFIGNGKYAVPLSVAEGIFLADIVAASSCFPGVFEPIYFPDDFRWKCSLDIVREALLENISNPASEMEYLNGFNVCGVCMPIPLMDGGVYDNQGISNAVSADKNIAFDLFLITDTSPREEEMLKAPGWDSSGLRWLSVKLLFWLAAAFILIYLLSIGILIYSFCSASAPPALVYVGYVMLALPPIPLIVMLGWICYKFATVRRIVFSGAAFDLWEAVKGLTVRDVINLGAVRFHSLKAMAANVFMKRVRQLQFNNLMDPEERSRCVAFNLIYSLNPTTDRKWLWHLDKDLKPSKSLRRISARAEKIDTKLWLSSDEFQTLLACGRATTCFSLLKFLWQNWTVEKTMASKNNQEPPLKPNDQGSQSYDLYIRLKAKWTELQKMDPFSSDLPSAPATICRE